MTKPKKIRVYGTRKVINNTMGLIRQLWLKGIPVRAGAFEFYTAKKQIFVNTKGNSPRDGVDIKKFAKAYYSIIFDPAKDIVIKTRAGRPNNLKRYRISDTALENLIEPIIKKNK